MKAIYITLLAILISLSSKGQEAKKVSQEERLEQIEKKLSVNRARAAEILGALDYHIEEIRDVARDPNLTARDKQDRLKELQAGRQARLQATLTATELTELQSAIAGRVQVRRDKAEQRQHINQKKLEKGL